MERAVLEGAEAIAKTIETEYYEPEKGCYAFSRGVDGTLDRTATVYPAMAWWDTYLPGGKSIRMTPALASVDSEGSDQKVVGKEGQVRQGTSHGADAVRIAETGGMGAAAGGMVDRSWTGAGIGGGVGSAVGLATVLLTRGREVELRQGATIDVIFDRPVPID